MEKYRDIKINNSLDAAVKDGKWKDPGASLYSKLINASHYDGKMPEDSKELDDMIKKKKVTGLEDYLQEAYLVVENNKIVNNPYGITSFNRSGCKYPHHVLRGNDKDGWELVVSIPGLKAAYTRAKQQGIFSGKVKEHLERHYKELGLYEDSTMNADKKIHENFEFIESTINDSLGVDLFEENVGLEINENGIGSIDESFAWMENFFNAKKYDSFVAANLNSVLLNRTPEELLRWMNCISYGWYSYEDQSFHGTDDDDPTDYFYKYYRLQTPDELVRRQIGVCWDCTELEREWFEKHNYQFGVFYLEIDNRQECPSHTFLVYRENNRYYWFEHSWYDYRGIHGYVRLQDLLYDVITKHQKANRDDRSPVIITLMKDQPKTNATCQEFIDHAHSQQRFYINTLPTSLIDESINLLNENIENNDKIEYVPVFGVACKYTNSKIRNDGTPKDEKDMEYVKFSKNIKLSTLGDNYSHALISLDDSFTKMYSIDDDGFCIDNIQENKLWLSTESIYICVMFLKKEDVEQMQKFADYLTTHKDETLYAYDNLLKLAIAKPSKVDKRFICSSITGYLLNLSNPKNLHRDYSRLRPEDITILPRAFYVMNVKDKFEFNQRYVELKQKVESIYKDHYNEIDDYNNQLPKIMLQDRVDELKTFDKIFSWVIAKVL